MSPLYVTVMLVGPVELGVNDTEQLPAPRVQVGGLMVPPVAAKLTVPVGVDVVGGDVSVTVTVQVDG